MLRRARLLIAVAAAAPLVLLGLPGAASADGGGTVTVLAPKRDCARPAAGDASCFAVHLVKRRVAAARAGAYTKAAAPSIGSGPAGGYTPAQVATAYGASGTGADQVVAIVDAFHAPDALANLDTFDAQYGFAAETSDSVRVIGQDGSTNLPATTDDGWAGETDLDLQAVRGLCRSCHILLVEADSDSVEDLGAAVDAASTYAWHTDGGATLPVKIVSNSYGGPESSADASARPHYKHPGVAVLASTGDHGWYDWDWLNTFYNDDPADNTPPGLASNIPASFGSVVGVGGTTLRLTSSGARSNETVWNRNGLTDDAGYANGTPMGATGSGCSENSYAMSFQTGAAGYASLGCTSKRKSEVDLAMLADPYTGYDVYTAGGWARYGGTSLSAPLAAAMWALAGGPGQTSYPAANLYKHFAAKSGRGLYDVTSGGNGYCGNEAASTCFKNLDNHDPNLLAGKPRQPLDCAFAWGKHKKGAATYQCRARKGLDGPSGVGAPVGLNAFKP